MAAVEMTNAQQPDLVLLTGDFVCHSQLYLDQLERGDARRSRRRCRACSATTITGRAPTRSGTRCERARRRGAAQPAHDDHAAPRAPAGGRPRRRVHRPRAPRRSGEGAAPRPAHASRCRTSPRRPTACGATACRWCSRATRTPARSRSRACTSSRSAASPATATCTACTARAATRSATATSRGAVYVGAGIGAAVVPFRLGDRGKREVTMFELGCEPGDFDEHHAEQEPMQGPQADAANDREARGRRAAQAPAPRRPPVACIRAPDCAH